MTARKEKGPISEAEAKPTLTTTKEEVSLSGIVAHDEDEALTIEIDGVQMDAAELDRLLTESYAIHCAKEAAAFSREFFEFPYRSYESPLTQGIYYGRLSKEKLGAATLNEAEEVSGGVFAAYMKAAGKVEEHYQNALRAIAAGEVALNGEPWPMLEDGKPDMTPIAYGLCDQLGVFARLEDGYVCPRYVLDYIERALPADRGDIERVFAPQFTTAAEIEIALPEERYATLCVLCHLIGAEDLKRAIRKRKEPAAIETASAVPDILDVMSTSNTGILDQCLLYCSTERMPRRTTNNRYSIETATSSGENEMSFRFTKSGKGSEPELTLDVTISNYKGMAQDKSGAVNKVYHYLLNVIFDQQFRQPCTFRTQNLVDLGIYKSVDSARKNLPKILRKISDLSISGDYLARDKKMKLSASTGTRFITEYQVNSKTVSVFPSQMPNAIDFFGGSYAKVPNFVWGLSKNAHMLAYEIFMRARQETSKVAKGEAFTVRTANIADKLGLPTVDEVQIAQTRKYREKIIDPIDKAIAEIRKAAEKEEGGSLEIEMVGMVEARDINDYLANGKILVTIGGEWASHCIRLDRKIEGGKRAKRKALETERAKAQVRAERATKKKMKN